MSGERADSRAGAGFTTGVGDLGAEKRSQSRFDESPGAHVLRFFLTPDELCALWKRLEHFAEPFLSEWIKLFDPNQRRVVDFAFTAIFQKIIINFAGAKDDAFHVVDRTSFRRAESCFEAAVDKFFSRRRRIFGAQQTLRRSDDEGFDEIAFHLAAQHMKILCSGRKIADLDVVLGTLLEEALDARTGMLRPLAFVAMREQQHDPAGLLPLRFCRNDELINDCLRSVDEIAELRLPQAKHLRVLK